MYLVEVFIPTISLQPKSEFTARGAALSTTTTSNFNITLSLEQGACLTDLGMAWSKYLGLALSPGH